MAYSVLTLHDTETDTERDYKWFVRNCVEVIILHRDRQKHRFPFGRVFIYWYQCRVIGFGILIRVGTFNRAMQLNAKRYIHFLLSRGSY